MSPELGTEIIRLFIWFAVAGGGALLGSYLGEKGKSWATKEDLHRVVRTTEDIKAAIAAGLWTQQQVWTFRKSIYVGLLETLNEMAEAASIADRIQKDLKAGAKLEGPRKDLADLQGERMQKAGPEFHRLMAVAPLVVSEGTLQVLGDLRLGANVLPTWGAATPIDRVNQLVYDALGRIVEEGKRDLGLNVAPTKGGAS